MKHLHSRDHIMEQLDFMILNNGHLPTTRPTDTVETCKEMLIALIR